MSNALNASLSLLAAEAEALSPSAWRRAELSFSETPSIKVSRMDFLAEMARGYLRGEDDCYSPEELTGLLRGAIDRVR